MSLYAIKLKCEHILVSCYVRCKCLSGNFDVVPRVFKSCPSDAEVHVLIWSFISNLLKQQEMAPQGWHALVSPGMHVGSKRLMPFLHIYKYGKSCRPNDQIELHKILNKLGNKTFHLSLETTISWLLKFPSYAVTWNHHQNFNVAYYMATNMTQFIIISQGLIQVLSLKTPILLIICTPCPRHTQKLKTRVLKVIIKCPNHRFHMSLTSLSVEKTSCWWIFNARNLHKLNKGKTWTDTNNHMSISLSFTPG